MDFIERIFGISPDGGNGLVELLYLGCAILAVTLIISVLLNRRRRVRVFTDFKRRA
jgi:hypothetical protein